MRLTKQLGGAVTASALLALGVGAQPAQAATQSLTQGFVLRNVSSHNVRLAEVRGEDSYEGRPGIGAKLAPGEAGLDHELVYHFGRNTRSVLTYEVLDRTDSPIGKISFTLDINDINQPFSYCSISWGNVGCSVNGRDLQVIDPSPTTVDVPAGEPGAQQRSELFNTLCADSNSATCRYAPESQVHETRPAKVWGKPIRNMTEETHFYTVTATDTISSMDLVEAGVTLSVKIGQAVEAGVSSKYQHSWTTTRTFTQSIALTVPPHREVWVEESVPVIRYTGVFTIVLGNTTWRFHDVEWDSPDTSPESASGVFTVRENPVLL
ncbi:hypothetical protein ACFCXT_30540 [Streptomyces vinaceus]|uniref:hypothetical protein n=1 Tax=Streptomyces vinaceus TaxID=1960 RepID=UPI0035E1CC5D